MNKQKFQVRDLGNSLVRFEANMFENVTVVWMNRRRCLGYGIFSPNDNAEEMIRNKFAYGITSTKRFSEIAFNVDQCKDFSTDRYGGPGVGFNGGSGRCGITEGFQIKGIGTTPLVGSCPPDQIWHSGGELNLVDGVLEVINSEILGSILPYGTVRSLALMRIDDSWDPRTGNYFGLLVRELCVRPAHFLYAANFTFTGEYVTQYCKDSDRVCSAFEELNKVHGGTSGVINLIGDFLRNCAAQFAFSRAHRLQHGVLSPSNISISGQWLDLANVSFVNSGINFSSGEGQVPFYLEPDAILNYAHRLCLIYSRSIGIDLNFGPLENYFHEAFDHYLRIFTLDALGLSKKLIRAPCASEALENIFREFNELLMKNAETIRFACPISLESADAVIDYIEKMYRGYSIARDAGPELEYFSMLVRLSYDLDGISVKYPSFIVGRAIIALKKALFSASLCSGRLKGALSVLIRENCGRYLDKLIQQHIKAFSWIFQGPKNSRITMIDFNGIEVAFDETKHVYMVSRRGKNIALFSRAHDLHDWVKSKLIQECSVFGFDFFPGIQEMLRALSSIENDMSPSNEIPDSP